MYCRRTGAEVGVCENHVNIVLTRGHYWPFTSLRSLRETYIEKRAKAPRSLSKRQGRVLFRLQV